MNTSLNKTALVFLALIALGALSRFTGLGPNFAAVAAAALFAGFYFRSRVVAAGVPLAAMLISDLFIGGYTFAVMLAVYACMVLPVFFRSAIGARPTAARVLGLSLACSVTFFLVTNFAVWASQTIYPHTTAGLLECYAAALPFFRFTLAGDIAFAAALFGGWAMLARRAPLARVATA